MERRIHRPTTHHCPRHRRHSAAGTSAPLFLITLLLGLVGFAAPAHAASTYRIFGTVTCPTGQGVVGVWVESSGGGSRFAKHTRFPGTAHAAYFSTTISTALPTTVYLNVGCGGSTSSWGSSNRSGSVRVKTGNERIMNVFCNGSGSCSLPPNPAGGSTTTNPVGAVNKCQCTYFAAQRWKAMIGRYPNWNLPDGSGRIGDAKTWDSNADRAGWKVGSVARPRSLFVENTGDAGHVGHVEDVRINSNGTVDIKINDQNADGSNACHVRTDKWIPATSTMKFIIPPLKSE